MIMSKIVRFAASMFLVLGLAQGHAVDKIHVEPTDPVKAMQTLQTSTINGHYWKYLRYYQGQITTKTCGLASVAMVMNTLDIDAPFVPEYYPVKQFNQKNFLNEKNSAIRSFKQIEVDGMTLPEMAKMLIVGWPVDVTVYHASELSLDQFRRVLLETLASEDQRVIGNFKNDILEGASGYGHLSPIAAYNKDTDEVLIMDVARHFTGPYWTGVERLYQAAGTMDSTSEKSRGLLVIQAK